ncbi:MAG TPA: VCBS repeat-containing protein [Pyrinomonadaceae bacterium]|jgi:hypothetical protein
MLLYRTYLTNPAAQAVFIFLLVTCASGVKPDRSSGIVSLESDLDGDGQTERIRLDKDSDPSLSIRHGKRLMWRGVPAKWKPWKLAVADVDGDGRLDIIVGVYKSTRYFPKPHNCLFIYAWDGRRAHPKWLGSSLGRPFVDFAFVDSNNDGQEELLAIEIKRDGKRCLAAYSWNGFGFTLDWQRGDWQEVRLIEATGNRIIVEADGSRITLTGDEMRSRS